MDLWSDDPSSFSNDDSLDFLHGNLLIMRIVAADLNQWLASSLLMWLLSRKYSSCQQRKWEWEYRKCCCGCGYKISMFFYANCDCYDMKESAEIPLNHRDVDRNPDNIPFTKEVSPARSS